MRISSEYADAYQTHVICCCLIKHTYYKYCCNTSYKLRIKLGPKKVTLSIDPITTRKKVTITASLKPKKTNATNVMRFARPSFIQGEGKGRSASRRCKMTLRATIMAKVILHFFALRKSSNYGV